MVACGWYSKNGVRYYNMLRFIIVVSVEYSGNCMYHQL